MAVSRDTPAKTNTPPSSTYIAIRIPLLGNIRKYCKQKDNFVKESVKYADITLPNKAFCEDQPSVYILPVFSLSERLYLKSSGSVFIRCKLVGGRRNLKCLCARLVTLQILMSRVGTYHDRRRRS